MIKCFNWNIFCPWLKKIMFQKETNSTFDYICYKELGLHIFKAEYVKSNL